MSLADLLTQTTPGPWEYDLLMGYVGPRIGDDFAPIVADVDSYGENVLEGQGHANVALVALAPDLAKLAIDMAAELRRHSSEEGHDYINHAKADALLARFAALDQRATGGPAVNAIERLRAALDGDPVGIPEANDALAAVDALYQAAKRHTDNTGSFNALAAAVRRIEGKQ